MHAVLLFEIIKRKNSVTERERESKDIFLIQQFY